MRRRHSHVSGVHPYKARQNVGMAWASRKSSAVSKTLLGQRFVHLTTSQRINHTLAAIHYK